MSDTMPRCTIADIGIEITGTDAPPIIEAINKYLADFAPPQVSEDRPKGNMLMSNAVCLKCAKPLGGVLGTFRWGMVHGEGTCDNCGWPGRAYHRPKDENDEEIFDRDLDVILQYHPSVVTIKSEAS